MTAGHHLAPLLAPRSVALVGASPREGTVGHWMLDCFVSGGFRGDLHLVNPRYEEIDGRPCHAALAALPGPIDMAVLNVASSRIEGLFEEALAAGVRAIVIFDYCILEEDTDPPLLARLRRRAAEAGVPVCGGNGMGYYNLDRGTHASFYNASRLVPGHIALIAHSGSVFTVLTHNDPRYRFNLVASAGQEIGTTVDEYLDYALDMPTTRVVALFIETVRNPAGFIAALEKARARDIPVVITKVGRTEESARLAFTHSGAIAGDDAAYDALLDRHGAIRARTIDEMMATALLLSQRHRARPGGLGAVTDSGGLREHLIDVADEVGVPYARISPETVARLAAALPLGLEPVNPLDAAGPLRPDFSEIFENTLRIIMDDPDVAMGAFEFDAKDAYIYDPAFVALAKSMPSYVEKPFFMLNTFSGARNPELAAEMGEAGVPLINGAELALRAVRHAFAYRDYRARPPLCPPASPGPEVVAKWRGRLTATGTLTEADGLALLADFRVPATAARPAADREGALLAAVALGYPVALKTAAGDIHHKSDAGGVRLALQDATAVGAAYDDLAARLGPHVTVQAMAGAGVELAFGLVDDPQFGPLVMIGAGGTLIEVLRDRVPALAPFDAAEALRLIDRLSIRPVLDGVRGAPAVDLDALADALARFSVLATEIGGAIAEMDVNPVIAGPQRCVAVDALVVGRRSALDVS